MYLSGLSSAVFKALLSADLSFSPVGGSQEAGEGWTCTLTGNGAYSFMQDFDSEYLKKIDREGLTPEGSEILKGDIEEAIDYILKSANIEVEISYSPPRTDFPNPLGVTKIKAYEIDGKKEMVMMATFNDKAELINGKAVTDGKPDYGNIREYVGKTSSINSRKHGKAILGPAGPCVKKIMKRNPNLPRTAHK